MKRRHKKINNYLICFVAVVIMVITIAYAQVDSLLLNISGLGGVSVDSENFNVHFVANDVTISGTGNATVIDDTTAQISASGLTKKTDEFEAVFVVKNDSNDIAAEFDLELINSDTDYIKVTKTIEKKQLAAGESATVTINVELLQTIFEDEFVATISGKIKAKPIENDSVNDQDPVTVTGIEETRFNTYSWDKIKQDINNNNLDKYNIGDEKVITISNKDYRVRLVNKNVTSDCNNTNYSETGCGFVVEFIDMPTTMAMLASTETTTDIGYTNSLVRQYLIGTFYNSLPTELKDVIATTRVVSGHGKNMTTNYITNDAVFSLSPNELGVYKYYDSTKDLTRTLDYYKDSSSNNNIRIKYYNSKAQWYWTRTAQLDSDTAFYHVNNDGRVAAQNFTTDRGVAPAFRIKKDTN